MIGVEHKLWAAREALANKICQEIYTMSLEELKKIGVTVALELVYSKADSFILAIESAGYRIVSPEATNEMVAATNQVCSDVITRQMFRNGILAAPTLFEVQ